ncbi:vacuolar protein sorting/targeting protein PEP1 [Sphagnurus paluster]|uniref:Vacuolar protein sorting/targeting protein 10 n=1 Tax=Sphagnurus paluster TaxID=117069 RepID=A0A9P7FT66_9AGAR|nr:vacuolar protein sorting/targeting protein PEP1 [Sphagnurus paluster]
MPQRPRIAVLLLYFLASCLLLVHAQGPEHVITSFDNLPANLFFFDDTESAIFHDSIEGNVYVSSNEGRTWKQVDDIPKGRAAMVIEHPFNNRYAFVLTNSNRHYRTDDRGKTWRHFEVPIPPALVGRPLSFNALPGMDGHIIYQGTSCDKRGWGAICHDETYYTKDHFGDTPQKLLTQTTRCQFAHGSKDFKVDADKNLIFCVAFDTSSTTGSHSLASSRLFSSTDYFQKDNKVEDLGIGKNAKGVIAFAIVAKYAVVAMKDMAPGSKGEMLLYVTLDGKTWAKAQFPHASSAQLRENAYTIVESTTYSLAVDVVLQDRATIGTLFMSNSNGTFFVESLKDTNRNDAGFVDYERLYGVDGIGLANVVANAKDVEGRGADKQLKTYITYDDGSNWQPIRAPSKDSEGRPMRCNPSDIDECSLHLHSITTPHNFGRIFSSPAPGLAMGVGSVGESLRSYEDSDTFLSTDAGLTWQMIRPDAHKYEFGDQGSILVVVNDEDGTDKVRYSLDLGKTWKSYDIGVKLRARALMTLPDSTSQKFILLGQVARRDQSKEIGRVVVVFLDFAKTRSRKCTENDFEKWYARPAKTECLMGHKQWYKRRKPDVDCYVGEKYKDPVEHEEDCECTDADYECDYNFVRQGNECVPVGPEPIPEGVCHGDPNQMYKGSSGYRKIPGNTCKGGVKKDEPINKKCSQAQPKEGQVIHQTFDFRSFVLQHAYFRDSTTILVRTSDGAIWQSSNEGYAWKRLFPDQRFLGFYHHKYSSDRAYLITETNLFYYTTDTGRSWNPQHAPTPPNTFGAQVLRFHPTSDNLIWTGNRDCDGVGQNCHAEAQYSRDNGRKWYMVDNYVRNCAFTKDKDLNTDPNEILCESYPTKKGSQKKMEGMPMELVVGGNFFARKTKMFDQVVGFAKFSEFLVVASVCSVVIISGASSLMVCQTTPSGRSLELQVSLDGYSFATGQFPAGMNPDTHAYTVLESSTKALFLHMTMSDEPFYGNILKSNSNGTYFGLSIENVNRNERGYVDFEKMIGLDGIALINVVSNPSEAKVTKTKKLQTRITHNDGSTWRSLTPPKVDSQGRPYSCNGAKCALHLHGYTERTDPRATFSSPSIVGLIMAVGNVGESLAPYKDSDTFLSRDGGFTWEEVHKDAHLWEFGDSGSVLVMVNDEEPTDHLLFSTDEGLNWREYKFTEEKMRVRFIDTVPSDTSRRFILLGNYPRAQSSVAVHVDFSALTNKKCVLDLDNPGQDDFELWSPSEEREERCLFGRQTLYHRRNRNATCIVGQMPKVEEKLVSTCPCAKIDFECEFNHVKDSADECVLSPGASPLPNDEVAGCKHGEEFWYERTAYRLIPYSSCEDGLRRDRGARHRCPGFNGHGALFWLFVLFLPCGFTALVAYYYYRRSGHARGTIRLPGDASSSAFRDDSGVLSTLASVPWFIIGITGIAWEWVTSQIEGAGLRSRRGYRDLRVDEDAQILRFEDEE